jgi:hypothetical protein
MTAHTFQLGTQSLLKVIGSVTKLASTDMTLPLINSVLLRRQGNYLTATASDRYVIGVCRDHFLPETDLPPEGWRFLLTLDDAKALLKLARLAVKEKFPVINFGATELELNGGWDQEFVATNVEATVGHYPNTDSVLLRMLQREPVVSTCAAVYMQRWSQFVDAQRIADKEIGGANPSRFWDVTQGSSPAWAVKIGRDADFVGVIMGCRLGDGETAQTVTNVSDWSELLK